MAALPVKRSVRVEYFLGRSEKHEQIEFFVAQHKRVDSAEIRSEIAGYRRRGVHEHAITAAAHEKRNGLVHVLTLHSAGVVGRKHHLLAAFVQARERFAAAENLLPGRKRKYRCHAPRIIRRPAHKRKWQYGCKNRGFVVREVIGFCEQTAFGIANFNMPGIFHNRHRAAGVGITMTALDLAVFPGIVFRRFSADQHQRIRLRL